MHHPRQPGRDGNLTLTAAGLWTSRAREQHGGGRWHHTTAGGISHRGRHLAVTGQAPWRRGGERHPTGNINNFGTVAVTSGNNVTLKDANAINLAI